jgi:hypothetical protein
MKEINAAPTLNIIDDAVPEKVVYENLHWPERLEGESYETYQLRRLESKAVRKMNAKGNLVWNSRPNPGKGSTYVKPKDE